MWKRIAVIGGVLAVVLATSVVVVILGDCRHNQVEDDCPEDWVTPGMDHVLVPTRDVQPGQAMDPMIKDGGVMEIMVPVDALVDGAATDVSQIEGKTTTSP
ncbi:MAG TPA: SAF domain-containing protein [Actinomycetota bacterium]|nr:SAF domain-containing protein [Actinomycetota bacterium]